ncbi:MAG: CoA transferase [Chloroflexota bacterium]
MKQPLEGIRVLELGMFHAGPGGGAILGDLGAEVIKIEQPGVGDPIRRSRRVGRVPLELGGGVSVWNEAANRSKKSVTIDLNREKGREALYRLVPKSDVFLTSMRRSSLEKLRMTYAHLSRLNEKLIYAAVSGYGPKGPHRDLGAFDYQAQGRSGLMYAMGEPGMGPVVSQFGIIDQSTSIMASHQILTALFMRERSGIGQEVHVSLLGTSLFMAYLNVLLATVAGFDIRGHERATENPLRNYYKCRDGRWLVMSLPSVSARAYWKGLCQALGHPELEKDEKFDTDDKRYANAEHLVALLDRVFASRDRDEWIDALVQQELPVSPVNRFSELTGDPQVMENDYIVGFDHPKLGRIMIPGYPVHFSKSWAGTKTAAPDLGEHTEAVLTDIGGYSAEEIALLRAEGVV